MTNPPDRSLEERVASLEQAVERLQQGLSDLVRMLAEREGAPAPRRPAPHPEPAASERATAAPPLRPAPSAAPRRKPSVPAAKPWYVGRDAEFWIGRAGIGLLLFGLVFLFKYAVERGWLTPWVQVALGLALGVGLAVTGLRVGERRRWFSHVMLGGAAAAWYITGFAAFQLLELVSYPTALGYMVLVTMFTFWAALRADGAALSVLGALGGLATPFLLYTGAGTPAGLVAYTGVVLAGTSGIYLFRGWRSLLVMTVVGGWSVLALGLLGAGALDALRDRWALQAGAMLAWLAFWAVPVLREVLVAGDPARWPRPRGAALTRLFAAADDRIGERLVAFLTVSMPLLALLFSTLIWTTSDTVWGWAALAATSIYGGIWLGLKSRDVAPRLVSAHAVGAAVLLGVALQFFFDSPTLLLTWAVEAAALHWMARHVPDRGISLTARLLFVVVGFWVAVRLMTDVESGTAFADPDRVVDVLAIAVGFAASWLVPQTRERDRYRLAAHILLLGWLWRSLRPLPAGEALVSVSWGAYGIGLVVLGLRRDLESVRKVGLVTLVLVVAKLFLVDLSRLEPLWRVLLFMGFGGLFLVLSYYFRALWKKPTKEEPPHG